MKFPRDLKGFGSIGGAPQSCRGHRAQSPFRCVGVAKIAAILAILAVAAGSALAGNKAPDASAGMPSGLASQGSPPEIPVAVAVRNEESGGVTRLILGLSSKVEATAFVLANPDRVIVDLPEIAFQIDPEAGSAPSMKLRSVTHNKRTAPAPNATGGLVKSFRFGLFAPGRSRIVIDLAGPARVERIACEPIDPANPLDSGPARFVIELVHRDPALFRLDASLSAQAGAAAARAASADGKAKSGAAVTPSSSGTDGGAIGSGAVRAEGGKPVIVIDPGHGGIDTGARGVGGSVEKDIVFQFARELADKLAASGRYNVVTTRSGDVFVALSERVRIAREADAALFVSIHADTLSTAAGVSGATIYTVSERASDAEAARVAEKENQADAAAGLDGTEETSGVADILHDLTRRETRAYAHVFARTLVGAWRSAGHLNKNPQRAAGFKVLKAPDVPSVLLELGYLSSDRDVASLSSSEWRAKTSEKVVLAIDQFFAPRLAPGTGAERAGLDPTAAGPKPAVRVTPAPQR